MHQSYLVIFKRIFIKFIPILREKMQFGQSVSFGVKPPSSCCDRIGFLEQLHHSITWFSWMFKNFCPHRQITPKCVIYRGSKNEGCDASLKGCHTSVQSNKNTTQMGYVPCMVYLPTFTIKFNSMWVNVPYMEPMDCV